MQDSKTSLILSLFRARRRRLTVVLSLLLTLSLCGLAALPATAQDLEDSIESELDGFASPPAATTAPSPNTSPEDSGADLDFDLEPSNPIVQPAPSKPAKSGGEAQSFSAQPSMGDEPNHDLESRLYRIYKSAKPVSESKWSEIIGSKRAEVYVVQPGDTLWDISTTMFGDGFFWSKLWAENGNLENPHKISNGLGVKFIGGSEASAPAVAVVKEAEVKQMVDELIMANAVRVVTGIPPVYREQALKEFTPEELADGGVAEVEDLIPAPEIPSAKASRPVLKNLPASFESRIEKGAADYDGTGLDAGKPPSFTVPASVVPNSYLADQTPVGIGKIEEIETGESDAALGQVVFLKLKRPAQKGERFSVVYAREMLKGPDGKNYGPVMEIGGTVEVLGAVNEESGIFRALVTSNINPVRLGSVVLEEELPRTTFARTGRKSSVKVRILGGEFDRRRRLIGENSVVYLDGGSGAGLNVGDLLAVQGNRRARRENTRLSNWNAPVGLLKVVKVEPTAATAVVLETLEEIVPGDTTGGEPPGLMPPPRGGKAATRLEEDAF